MRNPLRLLPHFLDALSGLGRAAARLPDLIASLEARADRVQADLGATREAVTELGAVRLAVEPLVGRLERLEAELGAVRRAVEPLHPPFVAVEGGMGSVRANTESTVSLLGGVNGGIDDLVQGVGRLEEGIGATSDNTALIGARMAELGELMDGMRQELLATRTAIEPVGDAVQRVVRFRGRLPGSA